MLDKLTVELNVIIGKLVPAGTGLPLYQRVTVQSKEEKANQETEKIEA